jgi:VWFA-related protein
MRAKPFPVVLAFLLFVVPALCAENGRRHAGQETVHVEVVNVDVVVLDKSGNRVMDLTRDDFVLRENGKPVRLTNFHVFDRTSAAPVTDSPELPEAAAPVVADEHHRLRLMLFLDGYHIRFANRNRILGHVRPFLDEVLQGNAEVMLLSADRRIHIDQPFTDDPEQVHAALDRISRRLTGAELTATEKADLEQYIQDKIDLGLPLDGALAMVHAQAADEHSHAEMTIELLETCVRAMSGLPGRKVLLYVSEGFPFSAGADLLAGYFDGRPGPSADSRWNVADEMEDLARLANGNRVTFYTLNAAALDSFQDTNSNLVTSLVHMASSTGGRTMFTGNYAETYLRQSLDDFRSYYSLGYSRKPATRPERFARIKVKVKRPGLKVLHRKGDFSKSVDERYRDRVRTALLLGHGENRHGMSIEIGGKGIPADGGFYKVPVLVHVPVDSLVLVPRGGEQVGKFRLFVGVIGSDGQVQRIREYDYTVELPAEGPWNEEQKMCDARFDLRFWPGENVLAVGLKDDHGADLSLLSAAFVIERGQSKEDDS